MGEEGQVIACHKQPEWEALLAKGKESGKLIVVDFTASWCGPCRTIAPYFSELAKNHPGVIFLKVDVDELNTVASEWKINAMPTFVFVKGGETVHKIVGADKGALLKKLEELKTPTAAATSTA
ncbi:thioredoxin H-type-like [Benincasa hispida]|uniref:thioredoxin H-type-like n=1 Tax=Benincasa hispida TaxID=102211 RepID=UPI0018FF47D1|nr:thioredoxin H-type-like [Benincasa hispida]